MKKILFVLLFALFSISAHAVDLGTAKVQGMVGEQLDGYLGFVKSPSNEVKKLVESVNTKRHAHFRRVAEKTGARMEQVQLLFYQRAVNATAKGQFYQNAEGKWVKKK